ncbi:MAG: type IV pilin protein [Methylococcales bacterium]|nr:type IV pilin protein [Methylococcales bacterium]
MNKSQGFTLIELMITVAIVGILAGIAYPSYQAHVLKSRRAIAKGDLLSLANALERHFTENNRYCGATSSTCGAGAPTIFATQSPLDGPTKYYDLKISALTASSYTIQAVPIAGSPQAKDSCGTLIFQHTGAKSISGSIALEQCW